LLVEGKTETSSRIGGQGLEGVGGGELLLKLLAFEFVIRGGLLGGDDDLAFL